MDFIPNFLILSLSKDELPYFNRRRLSPWIPAFAGMTRQ